jgi:Cu+-exporting ATPase
MHRISGSLDDGRITFGGKGRPRPEVETLDPVCGMLIDPATAEAATVYQAQTYFFCSDNCRDRFLDDPETYAPVDPGLDLPEPAPPR